MKSALLPALAAGLIAALPAATLPSAATAQTAGIATSNPTFVILRSQATLFRSRRTEPQPQCRETIQALRRMLEV